MTVGARLVAASCAALGLMACSSEPADSAPAATGGAAAGGSGGSSGGGGGSAASGAQGLFASFVPETAPGKGPALISFVNSTDMMMSLWVAQATFVGVPPKVTVGPDLTASNAVEDDTTAGKHESGYCVQFRLKSYVGPAALEPGKRYAMDVTFDEITGFVGTVSDANASPFVGVRAEIHDSAPGKFSPSVLDLTLAGERHGAHFTSYDEAPTNWLYAGTDGFSAYVDFVDRSGKHFVSDSLVEVGGAPGFTVVVASQPAPGAKVYVPLRQVSE